MIGNTCYPPQLQQPQQQPPTATFQPPQQSQQPQYPSQLLQQFQRPQQQQQQQQQSNSTFMPLYNVSQVMTCLHKSLADSMIKGAATGGIIEQFLTNQKLRYQFYFSSSVYLSLNR